MEQPVLFVVQGLEISMIDNIVNLHADAADQIHHFHCSWLFKFCQFLQAELSIKAFSRGVSFKYCLYRLSKFQDTCCVIGIKFRLRGSCCQRFEKLFTFLFVSQ